MARQGVSRPKVISAGRLIASGCEPIHKKRVAGRYVPPLEPAYSLYSEPDSKDQGLDRCADLHNGIFQTEQEESKPKPQGTKTCTFKSKPKNVSRKMETDKKRHGKKTNTAIYANKRPAPPVQKTIPSTSCHRSSAGCCDQYPWIRRTQVSKDHPSGLTPVTQAEHEPQNSLPLAYSQPAASCNLPSSGQVYKSSVFNCRLTTSTPTLSPQRPGSAHSESVGSVEPRAPLASSMGSSTFPSSAVLTTQVPNQPQASQPQPDPNGLIICDDQKQEICSKESGTNAEDEIKDGMDTTPVRDISEKLTVLNHNAKPSSPEKTTQKVMTVKYLLGELKTLVANQDSDAVRLISEVEQSISLLPVMVGSTNIQAEIALALQPLRSENVQLRRRLRILNQQLLERERAERRNRPEAFDMEAVALQSLNLTLQTQLNESRRELDVLQQDNMRLQKDMEDKDGDLKQHKDLCELENRRLRLEVSEALAEMQSWQSKLGKYEIEKTELTLSLRQREAEISRLQEVIRNLQISQTKHTSKYSHQLDLCQPNSHLSKSVLELYENAHRETAVSDKLSNSVKTYLQTLEGTRQASPPHQVYCRSQTLQPTSPGRTDGGKENFMPVCSPYIRKPTLETIADNESQLEEQKRTTFTPLRETPVVQLASGVAHSSPLTQCNELITSKNQREDVDAHIGLKYMGRDFEKLDIADGLHIQDVKNDGRDYVSDHHGMALRLNQRNKGLDNRLVQSQHARRCLRMGVQSASTGHPSVTENTFSSCDIKSLASDWSINSWTTFNTQDEENFRDGLAALDASIESLQKTLRVDLKI
ncbi:coiled-coil domain-containing protein 14 isoform X2 [Carassius auratus]|uniref:Coiled-coil domain-containing protein 14 isoform X2 n=1 Tax=Carassius auratus TaxID=7957 RepID=A0A6P6NYS5_CARAU|nr:coiled-coil domain-containing protein 14-like isoform X2 [Carassius auratus]